MKTSPRRLRLVLPALGVLACSGVTSASPVMLDRLQRGLDPWQPHGSLALAALIFALQTSFIVYLLIERRKRIRAEHSLEIAEQEHAAAADRLQLIEQEYDCMLDDIGEQLVSLQEEERRRIAAELHDSTAQHLVAIDLLLMRLRTLAQSSPGATPTLDQMKASLRQAQRELRTFTYLLYPPELRQEGLKATLERFVAGVADRTGLAAETRIADAVDVVPYPMQRSILRIAQEALANVHRHARASSVTVRLAVRRGRVDLRVADDGCGITRGGPSSHARHGVGIPGMRARALHFGGDTRIYSGRRGTLVIVTIPFEQGGAPLQIPHRWAGQRAAS